MRQFAEVISTSSAERLRELVDITRMFAERAKDAAQLRQTIAEQAGRLLGGYCLLGLISDDARSWHLVGEFSPQPEHANELRRAIVGLQTDIGGPTVTATVARTGRPVTIDDSSTDAWRARLDPGLPEPRGSGSVLVVEDDADVRALICRILKRAGYESFEASNEDEAERLCGLLGNMKLLIADVVLPKTSGQQIARRLKKLRPGLDVLYISGYGEHAIVEQGVLESGAPFVQKPILPSALLRRVRSLVSEGEGLAG